MNRKKFSAFCLCLAASPAWATVQQAPTDLPAPPVHLNPSPLQAVPSAGFSPALSVTPALAAMAKPAEPAGAPAQNNEAMAAATDQNAGAEQQAQALSHVFDSAGNGGGGDEPPGGPSGASPGGPRSTPKTREDFVQLFQRNGAPDPIASRAARYVFDYLVRDGFTEHEVAREAIGFIARYMENQISEETRTRFGPYGVEHFTVATHQEWESWLLEIARDPRRLAHDEDVMRGFIRHALVRARLEDELRRYNGVPSNKQMNRWLNDNFLTGIRDSIPWRPVIEGYRRFAETLSRPAESQNEHVRFFQRALDERGSGFHSARLTIMKRYVTHQEQTLFFKKQRSFDPRDLLAYHALDFGFYNQSSPTEPYDWSSGISLKTISSIDMAIFFEIAKRLSRAPDEKEIEALTQAAQEQTLLARRSTDQEFYLHEFFTVLAKKFPQFKNRVPAPPQIKLPILGI